MYRYKHSKTCYRLANNNVYYEGMEKTVTAKKLFKTNKC